LAEQLLLEVVGRNREVLPQAGHIDEAKIDDLRPALLGRVDDILRRLRLQRLQLISHARSSVTVVGCGRRRARSDRDAIAAILASLPSLFNPYPGRTTRAGGPFGPRLASVARPPVTRDQGSNRRAPCRPAAHRGKPRDSGKCPAPPCRIRGHLL